MIAVIAPGISVLIVISCYLGLLLGLGLLSSRLSRGTSKDFFVASHSIGPFLLLMSVFGTTMTAFALVGSSGLLRFPEFFLRLHAPTQASTLGVGGVLMASVLFFSLRGQGLSLHELLVTFFLFITAPVSAHLLARAARHCGVRMHPDTRKPGQPDGA